MDVETDTRLHMREFLLGHSSIGIIVHTGSLDYRKCRYYGEPEVLIVRQKDQFIDGFHPWGIPAGKVKLGETAFQTAERELKEETGMPIRRPSSLEFFCFAGTKKVVLSYHINPSEIPRWDERTEHELGIMTLPPAEGVDVNEIDRLALIPAGIFFDHGLVGERHVYKSLDRKNDLDLIPVIYRGEIWQILRHQMIDGRLIDNI